MNKKIAILGATSHIAKGLICNFLREDDCQLFLFARNPASVKDFLKVNGLKGNVKLIKFGDFARKEYDFIINCIGVGTAKKVRDNCASIFSITEEYDNRVLAYLSKFNNAGYINFSSGAVYGTNLNGPVGDLSSREILVNNVDPQDFYGIIKLNSEAKHRANENLNIVDIRIFSYFSRFIDLGGEYFLTDLINSIKQKKEFITNAYDFVRDYLHPSDLFDLIKLIMKKNPSNIAFDACSKKAVRKLELLDYFTKTYSLKYRIDDKFNSACPTGAKNIYYSNSRRAADLLSYQPNYSSIDTVKEEAAFILK